MEPRLKLDLVAISHVDPAKSSLAMDKSKQVVPIHKRSAASNFWHWVIYLITFTLVPRNKSLDEVTKRILQETQDLESKTSLTTDEKSLLRQALTHLQKIIHCNGGGQEKKVSELLATIDRIQTLESVKNLTNPPTSSTASTLPLSNDQRLKNLLQTKCELYDRSAQSVKDISSLLLDMQGSVELSPEQTSYFIWVLNQMSPQWIAAHAKKLSPGIIRFLVEKSLHQDSGRFIERLSQELLTDPIDTARLAAFVHSLSAGISRGINPPLQDPLNWLENFKTLTTQSIRTLEKNLSPQDLQAFIHSFFTLTVHNYNRLKPPEHESVLTQIQEFKPEYQASIRHLLSKIENPEFLARLLLSSAPEENLCNHLFIVHEDKAAQFYKDLLLHLFRHRDLPLFTKHLAALNANIFEHAPQDVQTILSGKLENDLKAVCEVIPSVPSSILREFSEYSLRKLFEELKTNKAPKSVLQKMADVIENKLGDKLLTSSHNYDALLPFLSRENQAKMLEKHLSQLINDQSSVQERQLFFSEATHLETQLWMEAISKIRVENSIILQLDPARCFKALEEQGIPLKYIIHFVNQHTHQASLLQGFFIHYFSSKRWDDTPIFQSLDKTVFQHFNFMDLSLDIWKHFAQAINFSDSHEIECFTTAFEKILSHPKVSARLKTYFYALEGSSYQFLASKTYPPAIRLNILCQAYPLDLHQEENLAETIQQMNSKDIQAFIDLFLSAYNSKKYALALLIDRMRDLSLFDEKDPTNPHSCMGACLRLFFDRSPLRKEDKIKIIKHLTPSTLTFLAQPPVAASLSMDAIVSLIDQLPALASRQLIADQWGKILLHLDNQEDPFYGKIMDYVEDPTRLRAIFDCAFQPSTRSASSLKNYRKPLLELFINSPWKLFLIIQEGQRNVSIKNMLSLWFDENSNKDTQQCQKIVKEYRLTAPEESTLFEKIEKLNFYCQSHAYTTAEQIYRNLDPTTQRLFTQSFREEGEQSALKERGAALEKMVETQLFAVLIDSECRKHLINFFNHSPQDANSDSLKRALAFAHRLTKIPEYQYLQVDFIDKLNTKNFTH